MTRRLKMENGSKEGLTVKSEIKSDFLFDHSRTTRVATDTGPIPIEPHHSELSIGIIISPDFYQIAPPYSIRKPPVTRKNLKFLVTFLDSLLSLYLPSLVTPLERL